MGLSTRLVGMAEVELCHGLEVDLRDDLVPDDLVQMICISIRIYRVRRVTSAQLKIMDHTCHTNVTLSMQPRARALTATHFVQLDSLNTLSTPELL